MPDSIRIRFVGGPRHNELVEVADLKQVYVVPEYKADPNKGKLRSLICPADLVRHCYHLYSFYTGCGTLYPQYVHNSLILKDWGLPDSVYFETFPKLPPRFYEEARQSYLLEWALKDGAKK